jgi:CRP-like cAMP-binding protein
MSSLRLASAYRTALPNPMTPAISRRPSDKWHRQPQMTAPYDSLEFFNLLEPEQRQAFERFAHLMIVEKDDPVISQESLSTDVFFVIEGEFEVTIFSEMGRNVFYRTIGPGGLFGELAAVDDAPRSATVSAQAEGRLVRLNGAEFKKILECSSKAAMWLIRRHTASIRSLTARLFEQIAYDVNTRIVAELLRLGRAAGVKDNHARIFPLPTHVKFATTVGTTREAVTRELGSLTKKGLISRRGREVVILDFDGLLRLHKQQTTIP